jgi:hypothetical protein
MSNILACQACLHQHLVQLRNQVMVINISNLHVLFLILIFVFIVLIKCSGQDITRRGGKLKNGVMIVLPLDISIAKGSEGVFGYLENMDSNRPELVLETQEVLLLQTILVYKF